MLLKHEEALAGTLTQIAVRIVTFSLALLVCLALTSFLDTLVPLAPIGAPTVSLLLAAGGVLGALWLSGHLEPKVWTRIRNRLAIATATPRDAQLAKEAENEDWTLAISVLSHTLANALASARLRLELVEEEIKDDRTLDLLRSARKSLDSVHFEIAQMRDLFAAGILPKEEFDINGSIEQVFALTADDLRLHGISLKKDLSTNVAPVEGTQLFVQMALLNVFRNAIAALKDSSPGTKRELRVSTKPAAGGVCVEIEDSGPGISPELERALFRRPVPRRGGMGWGLLLTRRIIEQHGGSVSIQGQLGRGTVFQLLIPSRGIPKGLPSTANAPFRDTRKRRVLVIDDFPVWVHALSQFLEAKGYLVDTALDSDTAWERIHSQEYDTIFLDLRLSELEPADKGGIELLQRLQAENPNIGQKVVVVTGHDDLAAAVSVSKLGARRLISKANFRLDELLKLIPSVS